MRRESRSPGYVAFSEEPEVLQAESDGFKKKKNSHHEVTGLVCREHKCRACDQTELQSLN